MQLGGSQPTPPPIGRVTRSKCREDLQSMLNRGRIPLLLLPSDRVLGLLFRPKLSIQLPWLRSVMLHLFNWSNPKIARLSIFFIQVVHGCKSAIKILTREQCWSRSKVRIIPLKRPCCYSDSVQGLWPFPDTMMSDQYPGILMSNQGH